MWLLCEDRNYARDKDMELEAKIVEMPAFYRNEQVNVVLGQRDGQGLASAKWVDRVRKQSQRGGNS